MSNREVEYASVRRTKYGIIEMGVMGQRQSGFTSLCDQFAAAVSVASRRHDEGMFLC